MKMVMKNLARLRAAIDSRDLITTRRILRASHAAITTRKEDSVEITVLVSERETFTPKGDAVLLGLLSAIDIPGVTTVRFLADDMEQFEVDANGLASFLRNEAGTHAGPAPAVEPEAVAEPTHIAPTEAEDEQDANLEPVAVEADETAGDAPVETAAADDEADDATDEGADEPADEAAHVVPSALGAVVAIEDETLMEAQDETIDEDEDEDEQDASDHDRDVASYLAEPDADGHVGQVDDAEAQAEAPVETITVDDNAQADIADDVASADRAADDGAPQSTSHAADDEHDDVADTDPADADVEDDSRQ